MIRPIAIAVAVAFAIMTLSFMFEPPPQRLFVEQSFIGSGHYAVTGRGPLGFRLFLGPVGQNPSLAVQSQGVLEDPYIVSPSRVLVTERTTGKTPRFRLLEVNLADPAVTCRRLIESDQYIAWPVVPTGTRSDDVLFFHGEYHPEYSGLSVVSWKVAALHDGAVELLSGPGLLTIGHPAQIAENRYLAYSYTGKGHSSDGSGVMSDTALVHINMAEMPVKVENLAIQGIPPESLSDVTSFPEAGLAFVGWTKLVGGRQSNVSVVSLDDYSVLETIRLAKGRNYGPFFAEPTAGGTFVGRVLSADDTTEGRNGVFWITEFSGGQVRSERAIKLEAARTLDTASCSPAETQF